MAEIAEELGFTNVSLSASVIPMIKAVPRGFTGAFQLERRTLTEKS